VSNTLLQTIRKALFHRWRGRRGDLQAQATEAEAEGMTVREAYLAGARRSYFEAVADLVDEGLVQEPSRVPEMSLSAGLGDDIH